MKIIPPFTRAHLQTPENFEKATNECYVAILRSFSPRLRPMITIAKTHTIIGNRKLQTLMVTAPIEAEEEVANMQLSGLQILDRTILPTADEIWRYSPSMYPKKFTLRIEGLPILCGDEELLEVIQMPCGDILSEINRHTVTTEIGVVYTGTAHATLQVKSEQEENILKDWSRANGFLIKRIGMELPSEHMYHDYIPAQSVQHIQGGKFLDTMKHGAVKEDQSPRAL